MDLMVALSITSGGIRYQAASIPPLRTESLSDESGWSGQAREVYLPARRHRRAPIPRLTQEELLAQRRAQSPYERTVKVIVIVGIVLWGVVFGGIVHG